MTDEFLKLLELMSEAFFLEKFHKDEGESVRFILYIWQVASFSCLVVFPSAVYPIDF